MELHQAGSFRIFLLVVSGTQRISLRPSEFSLNLVYLIWLIKRKNTS